MKSLNTINAEFLDLPRTGLFLMLLLDLLIILSFFLADYKLGLFVLLVVSFIFLNFADMRITLWFMIAFSTLVVYYHGLVSAIMVMVLGFILILVYFSAYLRFCLGRLKIKKTYLNLPIAVFLVMVLFQALRGIFNSYPLKWLGTELLAYLGFSVFFLVMSLFNKIQMIKKYFQLLIFVAYYQAILGLWNYFYAGHRIGGYLFGTFPSLVALVLFNLAFYSKKRSQKLTYFFISLPLVIHLLFSFTRGYWLGFIGALLFSYVIYLHNSGYSIRRKTIKLVKGTIILTLIILALGFTLQRSLLGGRFFSYFSKRFISSFSTKLRPETASNFERLIEYQACWQRIKEKPILGYGIGYINSFTDPITKRRIDRWAVHQFYLMVTLKMGLIGLFAFLWIFYVFLIKGLKKSKSIESIYYKGLSFGFIANSVQLLIISLTNHEFASVVNTFYLAFTLGGVLVITSQNALSSEEKDS